MEKEYISVLEAAKALKMSPARFANLLRKEREKLPVEIDRDALEGNPGAIFASNALKSFYSEEPASTGFLYALKIHRLDWKAFLSGRKEEQEFIAPSHHELEEAQSSIKALETELAACREQLEEARGKSSPPLAGVPHREKNSYLVMLAAFLSKNNIDPVAANATGEIRRAIEESGRKLNDKTIKKIKEEIHRFIEENPISR